MPPRLPPVSDDRIPMAEVIVRLASTGARISSDLAAVFDPALSRNTTVATLLRLFIDGDLRPVQLIETTGLSRGGMTKVIDHLEEEGLVERFGDPADGDGRSVHVRLTARGQRTASSMVDIMGSHLVDLFDDAARILGR